MGAARLLALLAATAFVADRFARLLEPEPGAALLLAAAGAAAGAALPAVLTRRGRAAAAGGALAVLLLVPALAMLAAGLPPRLLAPAGWDELAAGLGHGFALLPGLTIPYRGGDARVILALVGLGALLLAVAGALTGAGRAFPAAAVLAGAYAGATVERAPDHPLLDGALLALCLAALLFAAQLRRAPVAAVAVLCLAILAGALSAPRLDRADPWLDYRAVAASLRPDPGAAFRWDHSYGPLRWPRTARPVLRVRAAHGAYWKATALERFDGERWTARTERGSEPRDAERPERPEWTQTLRVTNVGLRAFEYVAAGTTVGVVPPAPRRVVPGTGGALRAATALRPGDTWRVRVGSPRPRAADLRAAGAAYPRAVYAALEVEVPTDPALGLADPITGERLRTASVRFSPFGTAHSGDLVSTGGAIFEGRGEPLVLASPLRRVVRLARRLRERSETPLDFVRAVRDRVRDGAVYDERAGGGRDGLVRFLFDERRGSCQHFSGAMALVLRMGGVPARVATGFSPGRLDRQTGEWVVTDRDAHSWVEAYFPGVGWVTFDPTPEAAPQRRELPAADADGPDEAAAAGGAALEEDDRLGQAGERPFAGSGDGLAAAPGAGEDTAGPLLAGAGVVALLALGAARAVRRRRERAAPAPPVPRELRPLERALRHSGRPLRADLTLARLAGGLDDPDAKACVRALLACRFGPGGSAPSPRQRRALARELGAGLGPVTRARVALALARRS